MQLDLSRRENGGKLFEVLTKTGVLGILETRDNEIIDLLSSFSGRLVHVCCGNFRSESATNVITLYANLTHTIRKQNDRSGWTENKLSNLQQQIKRFKNKAKIVFEPNQPSCVRTSK